MKTLIIGLLVLVVLWLVLERRVSTAEGPIQVLYRQAARYAVAASQDTHPVIAVLHANYAMGYLLALKDLTTNDEFKGATGQDLLIFEHEIARIQDSATLRLVKSNPALIPEENPDLLRAMYLI
jgi:hypothetical protein